MASWDAARRAKAGAEAELLKLPGAWGVTVGRRTVGGKRTDEPAIIVYLDPAVRERGAATIPIEIMGVPVEPVERPRPVLH